jgi:ABC-type phosphate transport system substrate-binding protein
MRRKGFVRAVAALAGGAVLATAGVAGAAQQTCMAGANTIGDSNTVFISGSSAVQSLLQHLAYILNAEGSPVKIVYQSVASCAGVEDVTMAQTDTNVSGLVYLDGTQNAGTASNPTAKAVACTLTGTETGINNDIGASDVYPATCGVAVTTGMNDFYQGSSVQVMEFAVNAGSGEFSISADAAYVTMGWAGTMYQGTMPWTDYTQIFIRTAGLNGSGTEAMIGKAIGLDPSKWLATVGDAGAAQMLSGGGKVLGKLQTTTNAKAALGIISAATVDPNKGTAVINDAGAVTGGGIRPLAFQANGQTCSYYADSTKSSFDKINVRQGRYPIWGPHHWITNGSSTTPTGVNGNNAAVATVISHLQHTTGIAQVEQAMLGVEAGTFDVPLCAMQVNRSGEVTSSAGGGEMSYVPAKGCGCYFESLVNGGTPVSSYCKACGGDAGTTCAAPYPACNYGFCEVQ